MQLQTEMSTVEKQKGIRFVRTLDEYNRYHQRRKDDMTENQRLWNQTKNNLVRAVEDLGFPADLGDMIAKNLGSPKAMDRMIAYLHHVKPKKAELVVDEMLAIKSEIDAWKSKKASEEANISYNELLYFGLGAEEDEFGDTSL